MTRPIATARACLIRICVVALVAANLVGFAHSANARAASCDATFVPSDAPKLQAMMSDCPAGTTYTFSSGTFRITDQLVPKDGDVLTGAGSGQNGTRITGSKVITGWTQSGDLWVHTGDTVLVGIMPDPCEDGTNACDYQDWLFQDGDYLQRVVAPCTTLTATQFCINYSTDKMFIGTRPGSSQFEYSYVRRMLGGRYDDVTVRHLAFDEFASNGGAIPVGAGWLVDDVHGFHNHACAVAALYSVVSNPVTIQNSIFDHNGYHGYCDPSNGVRILDNVFSYNNAVGYAHGSAVSIHSELNGLVQGNQVYGNVGAGITVGPRTDDTGSVGLQIIDNEVFDNTEDGIRINHSCGIVVTSNTITNNLGFAISVEDASDNTVTKNTIDVPADADQGGIRVSADDTKGSNNCGAMNDGRDNTITGNDVTMGTVADEGPLGNINGIVNTGGLTAGNVFAGNDYHMQNGDCSVTNWQIWTGYVQQHNSFSGWQDHNQDPGPGGTCKG